MSDTKGRDFSCFSQKATRYMRMVVRQLPIAVGVGRLPSEAQLPTPRPPWPPGRGAQRPGPRDTRSVVTLVEKLWGKWHRWRAAELGLRPAPLAPGSAGCPSSFRLAGGSMPWPGA